MKFTSLTIVLVFCCLVITVSAFATDDEWSDYDPCGWNAMSTGTDVQYHTAETDVQPFPNAASEDDEWSDYDPCGWNVTPTAIDGQSNIIATFVNDELSAY